MDLHLVGRGSLHDLVSVPAPAALGVAAAAGQSALRRLSVEIVDHQVRQVLGYERVHLFLLPLSSSSRR
jgi:hypothetical protein